MICFFLFCFEVSSMLVGLVKAMSCIARICRYLYHMLYMLQNRGLFHTVASVSDNM